MAIPTGGALVAEYDGTPIFVILTLNGSVWVTFTVPDLNSIFDIREFEAAMLFSFPTGLSEITAFAISQ